ncbi:hypothetical protein [Bradyrhizobium sp. DOA1]|uniref:hypothetical protein n=1 Tax=Bradyrhizobium sp. DOA1 TaxID=1126616 RepID=UPI00077CD2E6|nr:hypothetical protein [Bradyrhizobium sp. DOA1]KYH00934.1 hypothetical protein SE91_22545 [Bradyrhizobium sp. DOA1]
MCFADRRQSLEDGIAKRLTAPFYRKEVSDDGHEQLFYDVADASSRTELMKQIKQFIAENREGLAYAHQHPDEVEAPNLDIGIIMDGPLMKSATFDGELIALLAEFGMTVSISAHQASPSEE